MTKSNINWLDSEQLITAAETEDEIGTVLRMHLAIDKLLDSYLTHRITAELKPYIKTPRYTGQKLSLAAAFGMPIPFVRAMQEVNEIRNGLAHKVTSLAKSRVAQFARQVDLIKEFDDFFVPLAKKYIELPVSRPGERITLGSSDDVRLDFLISSLVLLDEMSRWLALELSMSDI